MRNKFLAIFVFIIFGLIGCSNLSKNQIQDGELLVKNGTYSDKIWKEKLKFDRYSWYHELTLQFDIMVARFNQDSPFNYWLSKDELEWLSKCSDARIALTYSLDPKLISNAMINEQFSNSGFDHFDLNHFKKYLIQHPDSELNSLKLYKVLGLCKKGKDSKSLIINIPGYSEKILN
jgi:hypothetical protein